MRRPLVSLLPALFPPSSRSMPVSPWHAPCRDDTMPPPARIRRQPCDNHATPHATRRDEPTARNERFFTTPAENAPERAFLAAVDFDHGDALWSVDDSLAELASLARTA